MLEVEPGNSGSETNVVDRPDHETVVWVTFWEDGGPDPRGGPTSFGINYGSISCGQLSGYIVFCTVPIWWAKPPPISKIQNTM